MFSKSIRVVYLYVVSFIFLMVAIFSLVNTVNRLTSLIFPEPSYCVPYDREYRIQDSSICPKNNNNRIIKEATTNGVTFLISTGLFLYHWNVIEKERGKKE